MAGEPMTWAQMAIFPIVTSAVGLVLAIPMRQLFIVTEPLPWPTGRVAVAAIDAVVDVEDSIQPRILGFFGGMAILYVILSAGVGWFPEVSKITIFGLSSYGVGIAWSPFILGAGYLIGMRVGWGFLVGAIVLAVMAHFLPDELKATPHKYIWPGVMALVTCGLTGLALNHKSIVNAIKSLSPSKMMQMDKADQIVSAKTLVVLLITVFVLAILVLSLVFGVPWYMALIGFLIGAVLFNLIATRAAGETAFNPIRVMGVMLQGIFALMGGTGVGTNLTGAGVAAGSIGQTGVLVQDTYFGRHFRVPAKMQVLGQLLVLLPASLAIAGVYALVTNTYTVGSAQLPSPIAIMWATMAEVFSGKVQFPPFAVESMWIGGITGIFLALIDAVASKHIKAAAKMERKSYWRFWPHSLGITLAMILPIAYDIAFFVGAVFLCWILPKVLKTDEDTLNSLAAAGIVGEGVGGLIVAILTVLGVFGGG
jgi:uncharacterized oligopeptide transporter (OPT) family protein